MDGMGMDRWINMIWNIGFRVLGLGICLCKYQIGYISTTIND